MDIILAVLAFTAISMLLLWLAKKVEKQNSMYETAFCRDVRTELGMLAYPSEIEAKRKGLNNKKSKF